MIRRVLLIARQEFLKYVSRRGFIFSLLLMPAIFSLSIGVPILLGPHPKTNVVVVVDRTGLYAAAIETAVARENAQAELTALAAYATGHADMAALGRADPALAAMLREPDRLTEIQMFQAHGGSRHALEALSPFLRSHVPFIRPMSHIAVAPTPPDLTQANGAEVTALARTYLAGRREARLAGTPQIVSTIIVIPKGFAADGAIPAQYFSADTAAQGDADFVRRVLADALSLHELQQFLPPHSRTASLEADANLQVIDPTQAAGARLSAAERLGQFVPVGLAVLLFMVCFFNSALLLQSVLEEKTTRMIEVLASCASPTEIMTGKLLGVCATALLTVAVWIGALFVIGSFFSQSTVSFVIASLGQVATFETLPLILLYFLCGILIYSAIFLGIGAVTNSLPDAQALLGPASLIIVLPMLFLRVIIANPNGTFATVVSWIPIYTPFFMLVRLPFHPPATQLWLTALCVVATTLLLLRQIGQLFARNLLSTTSSAGFLTKWMSRRSPRQSP